MIRKPIVAIAAALIVASLPLSCGNRGKKGVQTAAEPPAAVQREAGTRVPLEHGPVDVPYFAFREFGARMVVPEAWMDGCALVKNPDTPAGLTAEYIASYISADSSKNDFLGAIEVYTPAQWKAIPEQDKGRQVKVAEVNGYVYAYRSAQSNPYDGNSEEGRAFGPHVIFMDKAARTITIEEYDPAQ